MLTWPITRIIIGTVAAAAAGLTLASSPAVAEPVEEGRLTWGVVPVTGDGGHHRTRFDLEVDPGEQLIEQVAVINYSDDPLTLDLYARDAFTTQSGGLDLLAADQTSRDAGAWIEFDTDEVTIPARSRVEVPFRVLVPPQATPGDHAAGLVASHTLASEDENGQQIAVENRVGARVYLRVSGDLDPQLQVSILESGYRHSWVPFRWGSVDYTYQVTNTGNVRLGGSPHVATHWFFGTLERTAAGDDLPELLPGESFTASTTLPRVMPLLRHTGTVSVLPDPPESAPLDITVPRAEATVMVWAVPWTTLALLALVYAAVRWHRRRGQTPEEGEP